MSEKIAFQVHKLSNQVLTLSCLPEYGCHWTGLSVLKGNDWVDVLYTVLEGVPSQRNVPDFGSFTLAPWSNRVKDSVFNFQAKRYSLKQNFPDGTAIHGDVRSRPWHQVLMSSERIELELDSRHFSDFNYPFSLTFKHVLELSEYRLSVGLWMTNVSKVAAPVGFGYHPYFKRCLTKSDEDVMLVVPAEKVYPDQAQIPTGPAEAVSGNTDLKHEKMLGNPDLDHCFTDLKGPMRLIYPGTDLKITLETDPALSHVVIYTPTDDQGNVRNCVAVEPVTHVNNGFNLYYENWQGTGIKVLEPGETWGGWLTISFSV